MSGCGTTTATCGRSPASSPSPGWPALALTTVAATVVAAVPAHGRFATVPGAADLGVLLRANLARTLAWTASTALAAALLV